MSTERTPSEASLDADGLCRRLVEQMPTFYYLGDGQGQTFFNSPSVDGRWGYSLAEWDADCDRIWERSLHPDDRGRVVAEWHDCIAREVPHDAAYRVIARDGGVLYLRDSESVIRDAAGGAICRQGVTFDVSELVVAERTLRETAQQRDAVLLEIIRAGEEGRARVADHLHDDTVQVLAASMVAIDIVNAAADRGDLNHVGEAADKARRILHTASERVRSLAFELSPPLLEATGLRSALSAVADGVGPVPLSVTVGEHVSRYSSATENLVYQSVRSLADVLRRRRHATRVEVWVDDLGWAIEAVLRADGDHPARLESNVSEVGERVRVLGGHLDTGSDGRGEWRLRVPASAIRHRHPTE
jgi:PAS domain S-box-containing protein